MAMTFEQFKGFGMAKPCIQVNAEWVRLAMMWPDEDRQLVTGSMTHSLPHHASEYEGLLEHQQFLEYEMGIPCWIQRKVVNHFSTFETECWV